MFKSKTVSGVKISNFNIFFLLTSYMILSFSILESLEKESKDKDEKISKIKLVAVRAKKELDSNRKEVSNKSTRFEDAVLWKMKHFCT